MKDLITRIVSGGQTGVDRAALDLALALGFPCGGWCPQGFMAEDGVIDSRYNLKETPSEVNAVRTEWNVRDSDGTLIVIKGPAEGGTAFTIECATKHNKPVLIFQMTDRPDHEAFRSWLVKNKISVLNIAGPRESLEPGAIYRGARAFLAGLLSRAAG